MSLVVAGDVAFAKIFPSIGIARLGDSEEHYFFGPEFQPATAGLGDGRFRDPDGRIKRQAARFRLYGFSADGVCIGELNSASADITWSVHLANKKAAWFRFDGAEKARKQFRADADTVLDPRNRAMGDIVRDPKTDRFASSENRRRLEIDGGLRTVAGENVAPTSGDDSLRFTGIFRPDAQGRGGTRYIWANSEPTLRVG